MTNLKAVRARFARNEGLPFAEVLTEANILGVMSLLVWSMILVVVIKYLTFVLRADNQGEGGILALMALVGRSETSHKGRRTLLVLGLFGAALLYGDGVITPAISVLEMRGKARGIIAIV